MENMKVTRVVAVDEDTITMTLSNGSEETIGWKDRNDAASVDIEALASLGVDSEDDSSRSIIEDALEAFIMDNEEEDEDD